MIDGNARADRGRRRGIALGAALSALAGGLAWAATPADAVALALAMEQGRHCSVVRARDADGRAQVTVRGDFCDGRRLLAAVRAALTGEDATAARLDIDLDIRVGTLAGFNDETLRDASLRLSARGGEIKELALAGELDGGDVAGGLRRARDGRGVIHLEAGDAGAFLRLIGLYRRVRGGQLEVEMLAPGADGAARDGIAIVRGFSIAGEPGLRAPARLLFERRRADHARFDFGRLRVAFAARPGHIIVSNGLLTGEPMGATLGGDIDLAHDRLDLAGTMVPTVQFTSIAPIFFPEREGLFGSRYKISGPLSAPVLRLDPLMVLAPGFLRRVLEFKPGGDRLTP